MIGAIAGDIIGSVYEVHPTKTVDFMLYSENSRFTDDTVLTLAVAEAILDDIDYAAALRKWGRRFPHAGYGMSFFRWLFDDTAGPYNSWGNGSAMRVSPVGFAFNDETSAIKEAEKTAAVTHDHPEGIKGAQAVALAIYLARTGSGKDAICRVLSDRFGYDLDRKLDDIRPAYRFDVSCQGTVPEAIIAFYESTGYEDAVRKAVSLGGDSDTLACITGGIAQAFYRSMPRTILTQTRNRLPDECLALIDRFNSEFGVHIDFANNTPQSLC